MRTAECVTAAGCVSLWAVTCVLRIKQTASVYYLLLCPKLKLKALVLVRKEIIEIEIVSSIYYFLKLRFAPG